MHLKFGLEAKAVERAIEHERLETTFTGKVQVASGDPAHLDLRADIFDQTVDTATIDTFAEVSVDSLEGNRPQ